ncbi:PQQ-dependent sugar dehydrogenase [Pararhizobium mangrovi]|uniref:Sorbosone dehydrogenase family protein n=1 Tax=Pararhizobium mangrovi TaxID=2590452 RepID=A0A506TYX8_9HYPH|nr:sorbosone dehydrogenase family protein [Pararhizobium mangrovi]TPW26191.1 sorbosone dehydrogenase family protein [Pararhizobium mangrovi]
MRGVTRLFKPALAVSVLAGVLAGGHMAAGAQEVVTGSKAYGSWEQNEPGRKLLIRPSDLPAPGASSVSSNSPGIVARPKNAAPKAMAGFSVHEFASGLQAPRVIEIAPNSDVFVSDSSAGTVDVFRMGDDGSVAERSVFASGLTRPYGIAFYPARNPKYVYVANTDSVVRYPYSTGAMKAGGKAQTIVKRLPTGYHWTRDIAFSKDGRTLYVSVGSGSNVARGMGDRPPRGFADQAPTGATWGDERWRADVLAFDPDGGNRRIFATGLRNCSGLAIQPDTGDPWCVVNERDMLGDDLPPDYATRVEKGAFYGWPWYYIGDHPDPRWSDAPRPDLAERVRVPDVLIQPHSAPLGIGFYSGTAFPAAFRGDAFVALHGSWNRNHPTGYKVVRLLFKDGRPTGVYQDFLTGFILDDQRVWGRPVDVTMAKDGSLLVSEDASGTIWRVSATGE